MIGIRVPSPARIRQIYETSFENSRRERMFLSGVAFLATFASTRLVTNHQRQELGPIRNIAGRGKRTHHYVYGVGMLLASGYGWLFLGGTDDRRRRLSRLTTALYGVGSALTLDEFNIWLRLKNNYWKPPLRQRIDAAIMAISALSIGGWGAHFFVALARDLFPSREVTPAGRGGNEVPSTARSDDPLLSDGHADELSQAPQAPVSVP